jgi:uncharacterized membrane protein YjgN (DUF898 family)
MRWEPLHPPLPPPLPPAKIGFSGDRGAFFRLAARGAALELVTVGFYRFWLATDIRRHMWSHTVVDGDAAEYTGRGKELLIGFLFALAILVPIYLAYFLITVEAESWASFASVPLVLGFYAFGQFAIYRARRYRLTRTVWRGVRFWMDGSGWAYAWRAVLWGVLALATLGLAYPWREAALERYKMRHSYYGDLQGDFAGSGWAFFKQAWWLWLLTPLSIVLFPTLPMLYAEFKAREYAWWLSGIRFGGISLTSSLHRSQLTGLYWIVIGWMFLLGIALSAYMALVAGLITKLGAGLYAETTVTLSGKVVMLPAHTIVLGIAGVIGYLAYVLAINVVMRVYLVRDLWQTVVSSVEVHGIEAANNVRVRGELASALGEGFADGLDVAGF